MRNIWKAEWRLTIRQRSSYTFVFLWIFVLSLLFLLERNNPALTGYTNMTGTIANIVLYIVPLFMLVAGSFSIANEMENGQWSLLCTYPLPTIAYWVGKLCGQLTAQSAIFSLSFSLSLLVGTLLGSSLSLKWVLILYFFYLANMVFSRHRLDHWLVFRNEMASSHTFGRRVVLSYHDMADCSHFRFELCPLSDDSSAFKGIFIL